MLKINKNSTAYSFDPVTHIAILPFPNLLFEIFSISVIFEANWKFILLMFSIFTNAMGSFKTKKNEEVSIISKILFPDYYFLLRTKFVANTVIPGIIFIGRGQGKYRHLRRSCK